MLLISEMTFCAPNTQTGRSLYIDASTVPQNETLECKCSVNISETAKNVRVSYSYQGSVNPCDGGFKFMVSNVSLGCNASSISVEDFEEISFIKNTTEDIGRACLMLYIGKFGLS